MMRRKVELQTLGFNLVGLGDLAELVTETSRMSGFCEC